MQVHNPIYSIISSASASQRKQRYEEARSRSGHAGMSAGDEEEWQAGDFSSFSSTNPMVIGISEAQCWSGALADTVRRMLGPMNGGVPGIQ
jgi:hypothetical protein